MDMDPDSNGCMEGKIGLVDLESLSLTPHPCPVEELAVLFPLHKKFLMREDRNLRIAFSPQEVKQSAAKGKAFFKHMIGAHKEFCLKEDTLLAFSQVTDLLGVMDVKHVSSKIYCSLRAFIDGDPLNRIANRTISSGEFSLCFQSPP